MNKALNIVYSSLKKIGIILVIFGVLISIMSNSEPEDFARRVSGLYLSYNIIFYSFTYLFFTNIDINKINIKLFLVFIFTICVAFILGFKLGFLYLPMLIIINAVLAILFVFDIKRIYNNILEKTEKRNLAVIIPLALYGTSLILYGLLVYISFK